MNEKNKLIFSILLIIIFTSFLIHIPVANNNYNLKDDQIKIDNQSKKDLTKEISTDREGPKTADISEEHQNHNFSFEANLNEEWNREWFYENYNSTLGGALANNMLQWDVYGYYVLVELNITDLSNRDTKIKLNPSDFSWMYLQVYNGTPQGWVNVAPVKDTGILGEGTCYQYLYINKSLPGAFKIAYSYDGRDLIYNATIRFRRILQRDLITYFKPTNENTQSDEIIWEINYFRLNSLSWYILGYYNASVTIEELENFTIRSVQGYDGQYWAPLNYTKDNTNIFINESFWEYKIELQTPNLVSIISYNDNLTYATGSNELQLYVKCRMTGKLDIRIRDVDGNVSNKTLNVIKDEMVFFNYIMEKNATGGIGILNITLTNNSLTQFGIRSRQILFHKRAVLVGFSMDTSAFSELFVLTGFVDIDLNEWYSAHPDGLSPGEILNKSVIPDASVTYEFDVYGGELGYGPLYVADIGSFIPLYYTMIDLTEVLITPGRYNITFRAEKQGYTLSTNITQFNLFKRNVYFYPQITPPDKVFTIEETFSITINFVVAISEPPYYELFLRHPVFVNVTFTNLDTGEIEVDMPWPGPDGKPLPVVQSLTISGPMSNTTLPGNYNINLTIDSEYYNGSTSFDVVVEKKQLDIGLDYNDEVDEDENFDISWSLENGNFTGNRENMTLEIFKDGQLFRTVNLTANDISSGIITLKLDEGDHIVTYRLVSPFYEVERIITIKAVGAKSEKKELSWLEENWPLLLLLILAIVAMSIFGVYMTLSRRRVRAQRALDSELVALKTRLAATEENISLIQKQISEIAGIYWILVIHSEQGTTMVEVTDFRFNEVLGNEFKIFVEEGMIRDSALIGGFLTAIRNFARETSGTSHEYQPIFNSQTDYSTVVNDKEVHRRILEGTSYFMAFISARGTMEISEVLEAVNSKFNEEYGEAAKEFLGKVTVFDPFKKDVVTYLHSEIRELQKRLEDEILLRQHYERHLKQVQDKIGIKKNK
ncbi:MAG: hypothetical protein ACFFDK_02245 [Promethearchaeota archaeon]